MAGTEAHTLFWESDDQDVQCWIDAGMCLCLRAVTGTGDPVELSGDDLERLIVVLQERLAALR